MTAGAAKDESGITAPIDQDDRLVLLRKGAIQSLAQAAAENTAVALGQFLFHVNNPGARQTGFADPLRQRQADRLAGLAALIRFNRRGRRAEDDNRAMFLRAHPRDIAGVVARMSLRLVR